MPQPPGPPDALADDHPADDHPADDHPADDHPADGRPGNGHQPGSEPGRAGLRWRSHEWQDPAVFAPAARGLAGADFLRALSDGTLPPPPFASTLGISLVSAEPGRVVFEFTPAEFHYNPIGSVHGGVTATMCDSACGCAVHSMLPAGTYYTSQDLTVKFLRAVTVDSGPLRCEGTVLHLGSRTALAQASLTDTAGRRYAHATSSCLIVRP